MTSTFANARENLSDEQLKHVTGGARGNSRPDAAEAHLIDHVNLDLHVAAAADGHPLAPPNYMLEKVQFSTPVTVHGIKDADGNAVTGVEQIDIYDSGAVYAIGDLGKPQYLGDDSSLFGPAVTNSVAIWQDADLQGDQVSVTGVQVLPVGWLWPPDER